MKNSILKAMLAAVIVLVALIGRPLLAAASRAEKISFTYTFVGYTNLDPGTCDPSTYLPYAGDPACVLYSGSQFTLAGDLVGTELEEDSDVGWPDGSYSSTGYGMYTGTLKGHGTGSFVALDYDGYTAPPPNGVETGTLRIVNGTGTGDLVGISGSGSFAGPLPVPAKMTVKFPRNH
jgi:hypothetical protein